MLRGAVRGVVACLGLCAAALHAAPAPADATLLLAVRLNGIEQPQTVQALQLGERLALPLEAWTALHLRQPSTPPSYHEGRAFQPLDPTHMQWHIDGPSQTLHLDADASAFAGGRVLSDAAPGALAPHAGRGGWLNYDAQALRQDGSRRVALQALLDAGLFDGGRGAWQTSALLRDSGAGRRELLRLDSAWTLDDPQHLAQWRVGDTVSTPGAWGRALRIGGLQWRTDFSQQPSLPTFPLPSLRGQAAMPSTVELWVDQQQRLQGQVGAGAFELNDLPVVNGQGELRMVVRDLLGREQVVVVPYHTSTALLRPGLRASSFEIGALRESYGFGPRAGRYGSLVGSATRREGIDDTFTREWRVEASRQRQAAGATGVWLLPGVGTAELSAVASRAGDATATRHGALVQAALDRQGRDWSGSLNWRRGSRGFVSLGEREAGATREQIGATFGRNWQGTGLGAGVLRLRRADGPAQQLLSLNLARALPRLGTLSLMALRDGASGHTSVSLSLSHALGPRHDMALAAARHDGRRYQALHWQQSMLDGRGLALRLAAERGDGAHASAQALWQEDGALWSGGVMRGRSGRGGALQAGAAGGLAWLGGSVFHGRRIDGSFAIVDTGGLAGVPVLHDHRVVAHTDAAGRALVPGLRGHERNRISLDAAGLPHDAEVDALEWQVVPPARSGIALALTVRQARSATFRVVAADGAALPPGSLLQVLDADGQPGRSFPVGFDGRSFVSLPAGAGGGAAMLLASVGGVRCHVELPAAAAAPSEHLPDLGTLECH